MILISSVMNQAIVRLMSQVQVTKLYSNDKRGLVVQDGIPKPDLCGNTSGLAAVRAIGSKVLSLVMLVSMCGYLDSCSLGSVGSEKSGDSPGQCALNCDHAIIGSNDAVFRISPIFETYTITCQQAGVTSDLDLQWLAGEVRVNPDTSEENVRPVPFLSFGVIGLTGSKLQTADDQMCSDACGVMAIRATFTCPAVDQTTTETIHVHSGPLFSKTGTTVTVIGPISQGA